MKYSIVYIETRPEIQEKLSVGLIVMAENRAEVRTSEEKLKAAKLLLTDKEYRAVTQILGEMATTVKNGQDVDYMTRYSNNLITVSPLQTIDIDNSDKNREWLYSNYIYKQPKAHALSA